MPTGDAQYGPIPKSIFEANEDDHPVLKVLKAVGYGATNLIGEVRERRQEREQQQAAMVATALQNLDVDENSHHPLDKQIVQGDTKVANPYYDDHFAKYVNKFYSPEEQQIIRFSKVVGDIDKLNQPSKNQPQPAAAPVQYGGRAPTPQGTPVDAARTVGGLLGYPAPVEPPYNPPPAQGPPASAGPYATAPTTTSTIPPPSAPVDTSGARAWPTGLPQPTQPFTVSTPPMRQRTVADDVRDSLTQGESKSFYDKATGRRVTLTAPSGTDRADMDARDYYRAYETTRQDLINQGVPDTTAAYLAHTNVVPAFDAAGRLAPPAAREIANAKTTGAIKAAQKRLEEQIAADVKRENTPAQLQAERTSEGINLEGDAPGAGGAGGAAPGTPGGAAVYSSLQAARVAEELKSKRADELSKPLMENADRWFFPEGHPKAGYPVPAKMSMQQALDIGAVPVDVAAKGRMSAFAASIQHLKDLRDTTQYFFKDIHDPITAGLRVPLQAAAEHNLSPVPKDNLMGGKLASAKANILQLLRSLGEKGNIAAVIIEKAEGASIGLRETAESSAGKLSFFNGLLQAMRRADGIPLKAHEKALFNSIDAIWSDALENSSAVQQPDGTWQVTLTPAAQDAINRRIPVTRAALPPEQSATPTGQAPAAPAARSTGDPELDKMLAE